MGEDDVGDNVGLFVGEDDVGESIGLFVGEDVVGESVGLFVGEDVVGEFVIIEGVEEGSSIVIVLDITSSTAR